MAQILDVNSLIYIENGRNGTGWYIIQAGDDIQNPLDNGIFVEIIGGKLTYTNGLPVQGILDIYLIYTPEVAHDPRLFDPIIATIDNTQYSNGPVKILLTNDVVFSDYEFPTAISGANGQLVSTLLVFNPDVAITDVGHSEDAEDGQFADITAFNVTITFQNQDGTTATWTINQAELSYQFGDNPVTTNQNVKFKVGADGQIYTAREFVANYQQAAPFFEDDAPIFTIDENDGDVEFADAITATNPLNLLIINQFHLEGAPAGFAISDAGIISYNGDGLDYETSPEEGYRFTVVATAPNGLTASVTVTVNVADIDEPITLAVETIGDGATIAENIANSPDATVQNVTISVTDPEQTHRISTQDITLFDIDDNAVSTAFEAVLSGDSSDGSASITLHKIDGATIDHETKSTYNLEIRVIDESGTVRSEQVTINVTDQHDSAPIFGDQTEISIEEGVVFSFDASATGDVEGLTITYSIDSHDANSGSFAISNSGEITYVASDNSGAFDLGPAEDGQSEFNLTITADDGTFSTQHSLKITVLSNNEAPVLASVSDTGNVNENALELVDTGARFTVSDANSDDVPGSFQFDVFSGGVATTDFEVVYDAANQNYSIVKKQGVFFDYEIETEIRLSVQATDQAGGTSNNLNFTINVVDLNEDLTVLNQRVILNRGDLEITLTADDLSAVKGQGVEPIFIVHALPVGSVLSFEGNALAVGDTFKQSDVNGGGGVDTASY